MSFLSSILILKHTSAVQMGKSGDVLIHVYNKPSKAGLKLILDRETSLSKFKVAYHMKAALHLDSLWLSSASMGIERVLCSEIAVQIRPQKIVVCKLAKPYPC